MFNIRGWVLLGNGCYSEDFVKDGLEVTISDILDDNLCSHAISYDDLRDMLFTVVGFDVKSYIDKILSVDSIVRNEDRHFKNIAFICKDGIYKPAPIFDNGASCLSDIISYPLGSDIRSVLCHLLAKPFKVSFKDNFRNNTPLVIDYDGFFNSLILTDEISLRALEVIKIGLSEMEGISWVRC